MKSIVIFRDRVTYARRCWVALAKAGLEPVIVDHGSTWPAALEFLGEAEDGGTLVLRRGGGHHPQSLWGWEPFRAACGSGRYIVTDPDVVPSEDCPADWAVRLGWVLDRFPQAKAGLGLRVDRVPAHYQRRGHVLSWEQQFWRDRLADGVYAAAVDTTLALYRPLSEVPEFPLASAARTGFPYVADHLAWYEDLDNLPPELSYYYEHADPGIAYWATAGRSAWGD